MGMATRSSRPRIVLATSFLDTPCAMSGSARMSRILIAGLSEPVWVLEHDLHSTLWK